MKKYKQRIPKKQYRSFVSKMPIVSVDLLLINEGSVLLAKRANPPAKGRWFPPGGRVLKGESFPEAVSRIAEEELGSSVSIEKRLGTYQVFYDDSVFDSVNGTHYIATCFEVKAEEGSCEKITLDSQHSDYKFVSKIDSSFHPYVQKCLEDSKLFEES